MSLHQPSPNLAHKALQIVLQHMMIPDLGWSMTIYETSLPKLRKSIVESRLREFTNTAADSTREMAFKKELEWKLENEFGYFDEVFVETLANRLQTVEGQQFLPAMATQVRFHILKAPIYMFDDIIFRC
jgi:hypothetical protein